jgi:hypothetical protein
LGHRELTEKDLTVDEKKIFGRIIDMWATGTSENPYARSTQAGLIKRASEDGLSTEAVLKVLQDLEAQGLIYRVEESGDIRIKYKVDAAHIVKELQKTQYVHEARDFKPPHH